MLDALSDFWKPAKKSQAQEKLRPDQLQVGSAIGFGFVPQGSLSGRRLQVAEINTYQFGNETLTSFVLSQDKDVDVSMIVAESDGEQYLAISRHMSLGDRLKMFSSSDLENVMDKLDIAQLPCKEPPPEFKGWVVSSYKRELQGLSGRIYKGDFRRSPLPAATAAQEFKYTLLVSESNEHAIEIEKYTDGRIEVYATVYRRVSDIGEITNAAARPDIKLASKPEEKPQAAMAKPVAPSPVKSEPIKLPELKPTANTNPAAPVKPATASEPKKSEEKPRMENTESAMNGSRPSADAKKPVAVAQPAAAPSLKQEVKAVTKLANGMDNDAIECELRVANKIIDEAIRNEMRLSDVVRRVIELPVANQEAVQIPITLSDEDFALLAIRYSLAASDRSAIKRRIIEDLNDFSGAAKKKAAA